MLAEAVDDEVLDDVVIVVVAALLEVVVVVLLAVPGMHCEYQSFWYVQTYPDTQVVAPVHPVPPHWP